jgi:hypothetical protein
MLEKLNTISTSMLGDEEVQNLIVLCEAKHEGMQRDSKREYSATHNATRY